MSYRFNKDKRNSEKSVYKKSEYSVNKKGDRRSFRPTSEDAPKKLNFDNGRSNNKNNQIIRKHDKSNINQYSQRSFKGSKNNVNYESNGQNSSRWITRSSNEFDKDYRRQKSTNDTLSEYPQISYSESFSKNLSEDLIWGRHSTEAALLSNRAVHRIWCTSEMRSSPKFFQLLKDCKASGVLVEEVSWSRLGQITKGAVHQGIVLQIAASKTLDLKDLIQACKPFGDKSLLLALDGLTDPQNLGAIIRSAEALGAHGLVLPQRRSAGLTGSVAKVAAGALEHLPVARVVNLNRALEKLKDEGYTIVGLAEEGNLTLSEIKLDGPLVVVVGSEDKGISLITRRLCDQLVRIPLRGVTTSLNASVATSIFLYEVARTKWMKSISGHAPSPRLVKPQIASKSIQSVSDK